jgi:hypothetical protein
MRGLGACRLCLGLPLSGSRLPDGGLEELMQRALADAYSDPSRVRLTFVDGMARAFADEPGIEPAHNQRTHAKSTASPSTG